MKRGLLSTLIVILAIIVLPSIVLAQIITEHGLIPQPDMLKPTVRQVVKEPMFNTNLIRLTDIKRTNNTGVFPNSARRQAWNVDESLMMLTTGNGSTLLYDGQTYGFKKVLTDVKGEDIFWHPSDPFLVIYNPANTLYSYNVITEEVKTIHSFSEFSFASSRGGNLSDDGRYYAFVAEFPLLQHTTAPALTQRVKHEKLVLYDFSTDQIVNQKLTAKKGMEVGWISVSPKGNYIVVNYRSVIDKSADDILVYDRDFNLIWGQFFGTGSSDLAIDTNGDEVLIMDRYDNQINSRFIEKYRLSDGYTTTLLEHSADFYVNISARNLTNFGWCLVSTFDNEKRLTDSVTNWLPFEDEIFLLSMDGSQNVKRLAHHRSRRFSPTTPDEVSSTAFAEPQASLSRNADRLVFATNWNEQIATTKGIDAYIVDLRGMEAPLNDFHLVVSPEVMMLAPGLTANIEIDVQRFGNFSDDVDIDLTISPDGENFRVLHMSFFDLKEKAKERIVVKVMPLGGTPADKYLVHIVGKIADKTHHAGVLVTVSNIIR